LADAIAAVCGYQAGGRGVEVETGESAAEVPVRWEVLSERAGVLVLDYSEPSRAERSRPDGGKLAVV